MTRSSVLCTLAMLAVRLLFTQSSIAQTDSVLSLYPLNIGDLHQYRYSVSSYPDRHVTSQSSYFLEQVLGDTILPNGLRYKVVESHLPDQPYLRFLRVDTINANVYSYDDYPTPHECLEESLRAAPGSTFFRDCALFTDCVSLDSLTVFGRLTPIVRFHSNYVPFGASYVLAYGLGHIQTLTYEDDPDYPVYNSHLLNLVFARINGKEWGTFVSIRDGVPLLPSRIQLSQNYPNPFNPTTTIRFGLPRASSVTIKVFNILGQHIATLARGIRQAGYHELRFDGSMLPSGTYFYRMQTGDFVQTKKFQIQR